MWRVRWTTGQKRWCQHYVWRGLTGCENGAWETFGQPKIWPTHGGASPIWLRWFLSWSRDRLTNYRIEVVWACFDLRRWWFNALSGATEHCARWLIRLAFWLRWRRVYTWLSLIFVGFCRLMDNLLFDGSGWLIWWLKDMNMKLCSGCAWEDGIYFLFVLLCGNKMIEMVGSREL